MASSVSVSNNLISAFLFDLYGQEVKEDSGKRGTTYTCNVKNSVRVITDPYGGCHLDFPANAVIQ